jgi:hypothetical protein
MLAPDERGSSEPVGSAEPTSLGLHIVRHILPPRQSYRRVQDEIDASPTQPETLFSNRIRHSYDVDEHWTELRDSP